MKCSHEGSTQSVQLQAIRDALSVASLFKYRSIRVCQSLPLDSWVYEQIFSFCAASIFSSDSMLIEPGRTFKGDIYV